MNQNASSEHRPGFIQAWGPALLFMAVVLILSSLPGSTFEGTPEVVSDKLVHFILFAPVGFCLARGAALRRRRPAFLFAMGISILFAAFDELHQGFIPGRFVEALDFAADVGGSLLGIIVRILAGEPKR